MSQEEFIVPLKNYNRKIKTLWTFGGLGAGKRLNQRSQRHCPRLWGGGGSLQEEAADLGPLLGWAMGRDQALGSSLSDSISPSSCPLPAGGTRSETPPPQTLWQWVEASNHPLPPELLLLAQYADDIMILIILITELLLLIQSMHCALALCVIHCCKHFKYISWFKFSQLAYEGGHVIIPKITQLGNHTLHSSPLPKLEGERKKPLFLVGRKAEHRSHIQEAMDKYKWIKRALSLCSY